MVIRSIIHYVRQIGMEIPLCIYMLTSYLKSPIFSNLIYEKSCYQLYQNETLCSNPDLYYRDNQVQTEANHFYSISSYTLIFPSLFSTLILGVVSDFWNLKIPLIVPFVGLILCTTNYIIQTVKIHSSIYLLLISDAIFGVCGGYISIISTTMSYGVKTTSRTGRSYRIAGMEGAIGLGGTVGFALSGTIRQALGYAWTFGLILALQILALTYILVFAKERIESEETIVTTEDTESEPDERSCMRQLPRQIWGVLCSFYQLLVAQRDTRIFIALNLLALGFELFLSAGLGDIQYSYLHYKLGWIDKQIGWFNGVSYGLTTAAILTIYPFLRARGRTDGQLGCFGFCFKFISLLMLAFVQNAAMAYSVSVLTTFNRFISAGFRSFLSSLILPHEQGKMFSLIALLEGCTGLIATSVYNNLYPLTLSFFPGLCYLVTSCLIIPSALILGISDYLVNKNMITRI